jgi:multidrug efflux pump subunit AcrA (membrane-fusion protein)
MKLNRLTYLAALAALLLTACSSAATATVSPNTTAWPPVGSDAAVVSQGRVSPQQYADISFNASGRVAEVLAKEGDAVTAGQVLARLESSDAEETNVARAQKDADVARAQQEVAAAQQEVVDAQQAVAQAQQEVFNAHKAITDMTTSTAMALNLAQAETNIADLQKQIDDGKRNLGYLTAPDLKYYRDQAARAQDNLTVTLQTAGLTDLQMAVTQAQDAVAQRQIELTDAKNLAGWGGAKIALDAQKNYDLAVDTLKNAQLRLAQAQITNGNAIDDAQKALKDAQKVLNSILAGPDAIKVAQAQAKVDLLQAKLAQAKVDQAKLQANNGLDVDKLKTAQDRVATAEDQLVSAQGRVVTAQARGVTAEANLVAVQMKTESVELKAPFAATVAVQNLKVGEHVNMGEAVVTLADFGGWEIQTDDLTEIEVVKIKPGQVATVKLDALPDVRLNGTVKSISSKYEEKRGDITYTVTLVVAGTDAPLRWGMTAEVTFEK